MTEKSKQRAANASISFMAFESYAALIAKRDEILEHQGVLNKEIAEVNRALGEMKEQGETFETLAHKAQVAKLLGEEAPSTFTDQATITRLQSESATLATALSVLKQRIEAERVKISAEICAKVKPQHDKLVAVICDALIALHRAKVAYEGFTDGLNAESVAWSAHLRSMRPDVLRISFDRNGSIASYVKEAVRFGMISAEALPEEWPIFNGVGRPGGTVSQSSARVGA